MLKSAAFFVYRHSEWLFWVGGLVSLYFLPADENHFSLCPLDALGFTWCPGCGLGHSIHYYLHLDFQKGWDEHYLGIFALPVIFYRIFSLSKNQLLKFPLK